MEDATTQFEIMVSNFANRFLTNSLDSPQRLLPIAEKVALEGKKIATKSADPVKESAKNLAYVSEGDIIIMDQFRYAVASNDFSQVTEAALLTWLEPEKIAQVDHSDSLMERYESSIKQNLERGIELPELYYQNYFIEYVAGLMLISVIQNLNEKKELLAQIKPLLSLEDRTGMIPYGIFNKVANNFKKDLVRQYYRYETILKIHEIDEKES